MSTKVSNFTFSFVIADLANTFDSTTPLYKRLSVGTSEIQILLVLLSNQPIVGYDSEKQFTLNVNSASKGGSCWYFVPHSEPI